MCFVCESDNTIFAGLGDREQKGVLRPRTRMSWRMPSDSEHFLTNSSPRRGVTHSELMNHENSKKLLYVLWTGR